ncbi:ABC transporter substrate-binding protein [Candidatus Epulonipiscium viviparus]|uniref:ABC transporter substrate-binding protein n=1 Tax=Candidatus Epulonipiscium viviparus TaxID=420336 RepID=UPI0027380849|nr:extracellular solute-binding protein [Candidatus Epulopiscium viviparus]
MKIFKIFTLTLGLSIALTACASADPDATDDISMIWWGNQVRNEVTQDALDLFSQQNGNISIDPQFSNWSEYWGKLAILATSKSLPDVIQQDHAYINQYVENGLIVNLNPYIESGALNVSNIDPNILASGTVDGNVYAICAGINAPALAYNKTLLDDLGIAVDNDLSIAEFVAISKEVYEKSGVKTDFGLSGSFNMVNYTLRGEGKSLYNAAGDALGVDSEDDLLTWFQLYEQGIAEKWAIGPEILVERVGNEQSPLVYGNTPETRSWCEPKHSNELTVVQNIASLENIDIALTTWPSDDITSSNYLKPGQFFSLSAHNNNPDLAVKLLDFLTNSIEANQILLAERGIPASNVVASELLPYLNDVQKEAATYVNDVVATNSSVISPPDPPKSGEINALLFNLMEQIGYGVITAEEAAAEFFESGNKILANK